MGGGACCEGSVGTGGGGTSRQPPRLPAAQPAPSRASPSRPALVPDAHQPPPQPAALTPAALGATVARVTGAAIPVLSLARLVAAVRAGGFNAATHKQLALAAAGVLLSSTLRPVVEGLVPAAVPAPIASTLLTWATLLALAFTA